jgi:predicted cupin superfamily sugar epimerase
MLKEDLISVLDLQPHPEGGYYKETYRSEDKIHLSGGPHHFPNNRNFATSIYFLIEKNNFSAFHRIKSDETWHFYEGDPLEVIEIDLDGNLLFTTVGRNIRHGETYQHTVKAGHWFASRVLQGGNFSFVGCSVSPGFDFNDFELAIRDELIHEFPQHQDIIKDLTRI